MKRVLGLSLGLIMAVSTAAAEDLKAVYERALAHDPQIREAEALRRATREAKPQAWAAILPQISGSASRTKAESEVEGQFPQEIVQNGQTVVFNFLSSSSSKPETDRWSLDLRQSLISWDNWVAIKRADRQVAQAEADFQAAEQQLILRVSEAYFNVLAAQDSVDAQASTLEAISRQLEQAEKRFEVGLIAITDVHEARAARDSAAAAVIAAGLIDQITAKMDSVEIITRINHMLFDEEDLRGNSENYYDPDDALGWPLKPLSKEYANLVNKDIPMNSGGFFTSWTPFSHGSYWKDKDFLTPVAKLIKSIMS